MNSKTSGNLEERMKPWNYKRWGFDYIHALVDGTTKRFNDNSKLVVVDGPPALGKTEVAKALAEEFDMKFVPGWTMENFYVNSYGFDLRELDHKFTYERNLSYDERKFAQDPAGQDGGLDRMLWTSYHMRYLEYMDCLEHIFNTGQGVVTERSPHSDYVYIDAAYQQGWIDRSTKQYYYKMRELTVHELLRPNLIIYLDAPTEVVQSNIRARAASSHPWEANSPVWENTAYLDSLYQRMLKRDYLSVAAESSYVLTYDWSEGGDVEVVVEDIERLQMDYHDKYDKQQKDWRLMTEDGFASKRNLYTKKDKLLGYFNDPFWGCDRLILSTAEATEQDRVRRSLPGNFYRAGFNTELGDPEPFWGTWGRIREGYYTDTPYSVENALSDAELTFEDNVKRSKRAAGDPNWWK